MAKEKVKKKFGIGRLTIIVVLCAVAWACFMGADLQGKLVIQAGRQANLAQKEQDLQRERDYRTNSLNYIDSDEYIEKQARERFGWVKPDEIILRTVEKEGVPVEQGNVEND